MVLGLFAVLVLAPVYRFLIPRTLYREAVVLGSLAALAVYDVRLPLLVLGVTFALFLLMRLLTSGSSGHGPLVASVGLSALGALFIWNKLAGGQMAVLPTQGGLAFLGVSYLVLKVAAALVETNRGGIRQFSFTEVLAWIVFLPTYPSGPMEDFEHFRSQQPTFSRATVLGGMERILFGLVKALIVAHYLGTWVQPILAAPWDHQRFELLLGLYAVSLRFYFDFSGYSDIAIGLGALYGYDIEENFDNPLIRRNLVQLWQRWHMTLTRWLRLYLFIPVSRRIIRHGGRAGEYLGIAAGQIVAMTFCGLWHGLSWNFALWGLLQALGLIWVGVVCREVGRRLPSRLVLWWRQSHVAYVLSTVITFNAFSVSCVFLVGDVSTALVYFHQLLRP